MHCMVKPLAGKPEMQHLSTCAHATEQVGS